MAMKRMINFANGAQIRCPYHQDDIDVMSVEGCMPRLEDRCQYLEKINVGAVDCGWTEKDGHGDLTGG